MHQSVYALFQEHGRAEDFDGKAVVEVGSYDVNGSIKSLIVKNWKPSSYSGIDARPGPCVDFVCDASGLVDLFGTELVDVVVSTEMLEHAEDWRTAIDQMKKVLRPHGMIYLTCRGPGFPKHDFPGDYWRFTVADMNRIFADFNIVVSIRDPGEPGIFLKARKPGIGRWSPVDLWAIDVAKVA
jgi:SAM-dependent methyltransferase